MFKGRKSENLAILVLGLAGGRMYSETRLQKAAFLVDREVIGNTVKFEPSVFGPHSRDLERAVEVLEKEGKIEIYADRKNEVCYDLTEKGKDEFSELRAVLGGEIIERAAAIVGKIKTADLVSVIASVYAKYPEYFDDRSFVIRLARKHGLPI